MPILGAHERIPGLILDHGGAVINLAHPEYAPDRTGVLLARTKIKAACDALVAAADEFGAATLFIPAGNYNIGPLAANEQVFQFVLKKGLSFVSPGARFICNTATSPSQPFLFAFDGCERIGFEGLRMRDDGADVTVNWRGAKMFAFYANSAPAGHLRGYSFKKCWSEKGVSFLWVSGQSQTVRMQQFLIADCGAQDTYYGLEFIENGDDVVVRNFKSLNVRRTYFPYGVNRHDIDLKIDHDGVAIGANSAILIKRYFYDTSAVRVRAAFSGSAAQYVYGATLEHQGDPYATTVQAAPAPTATVFAVAAGFGANYFAGERTLVNGVHGRILSIAGDTFTLAAALGFTPVAGQTVEAVSSITDVDVELHLATGLKSVNAMIPFCSRSYTPAGALEVTTKNHTDRVKLGGSLGDFSGATMIDFGSIQTTEGRLVLDPSLSLTPKKANPHYPGFVLRTAHDREVRTKIVDMSLNTLANPVLTIPLAGLDELGFILDVALYVQDSTAALVSQNTVYRRDTIIGFNAGGGPVGIQSVTNQFTHFQGTAPTVVYSASGENIICTIGGAAYIGAAGANASARMEVTYVGKGPWRTA